MPRTIAPISDRLQQVVGRLKKWRKAHPPRTRLPEELWAAAVELAEAEGVYSTARALRLDYANLKRRVGETPTVRVSSRTARGIASHRTTSTTRERSAEGKAATDFVELLTGSIGATDCVIELEGRGGRMRIQMKLATPQVMSLVREWREDRARDDDPIWTLGKRGGA